jgi:sugar phosphate isomerase/epimerase
MKPNLTTLGETVMKRLMRGIAYAAFCCCLSGIAPATAKDGTAGLPFFAFDNGVGRGTWQPEQQAELLKELGYDGIGYTGVENIPAMLEALEARNLKMFSTYLPVNLGPGQVPYDPDLPKAIGQLKGHGTALWLHVHGAKSPDASLDDRAVTVIREIAAMADAAGLPVVLYPHTGFYVATASDAVRVVKKVDRKNVGVSFNLCHFLKQSDESQLQARLAEAMPYLFLVSINGADSGDTRQMGWERLIQTLDRGTFDVGLVLKQLAEGGYEGPIGLQCYAIKGDIRENLQRSIQAWRALQGRTE